MCGRARCGVARGSCRLAGDVGAALRAGDALREAGDCRAGAARVRSGAAAQPRSRDALTNYGICLGQLESSAGGRSGVPAGACRRSDVGARLHQPGRRLAARGERRTGARLLPARDRRRSEERPRPDAAGAASTRSGCRTTTAPRRCAPRRAPSRRRRRARATASRATSGAGVGRRRAARRDTAAASPRHPRLPAARIGPVRRSTPSSCAASCRAGTTCSWCVPSTT